MKTQDKKRTLFLSVSNNPRGDGTVFTFAQAFEPKARDMVSQLPAYLAFKHPNQVLEYFTAEAATRAMKVCGTTLKTA